MVEQPTAARGIVHEQIADTAKGIAGEFWEQMATGTKRRGKMSKAAGDAANKFHAAWPHQKLFIQLKWPEFVNAARGAMVALLGKPSTPEALKAQIKEALQLDGIYNPRHLAPEAVLGAPRSLIQMPTRKS